MARALLLDLDGTLVDSRADLADAGNAARGALGLPPLPLEEVAGFVGDGAARLVERLTPGCAADARARAMAAFLARYRAVCCRATRPYPGIPELLAGARRGGWRLAVATNKPLAFTVAILAGCGLQVDAVRGGDRVRKPDPAMLHELLAECGAQPAASWMAGDHHTDLAAGRAAGCRTAFCAWGFGRRDGQPADLAVASPAELAERLGLGSGAGA